MKIEELKKITMSVPKDGLLSIRRSYGGAFSEYSTYFGCGSDVLSALPELFVEKAKARKVASGDAVAFELHGRTYVAYVAETSVLWGFDDVKIAMAILDEPDEWGGVRNVSYSWAGKSFGSDWARRTSVRGLVEKILEIARNGGA